MTPSDPDRPVPPAAATHAAEWQTVLRLSHDLNNLLGAIVGYTEMLAEDVAPDAAIAPDLRRVHESAQRAAALVANLMEHARRARAGPGPG